MSLIHTKDDGLDGLGPVPPQDHGPPQPRHARTPAEFVVLLRRLKGWSALTYRELEHKSREAMVLPAAQHHRRRARP
jgi:hypothetical protein